MTLSDYALDNFVVQELSQLTSCNAPDITHSEYALSAEHYLRNFILNSVLNGRLKNPTYAYLFNFLRRTQAAVSEYLLAREKLKTYIDTLPKQRVTLYLSSLSNFEMFLAQSAQASALLEKFLKEEAQWSGSQALVDQFKKIRIFYEFSKHAELQISNQSYPLRACIHRQDSLWIMFG